MTTIRRVARCCCRQCSITVAGDPVINAVCHCSDCQRRTGSAFGWSTYFHDDQIIEKAGPLTAYQLPKPALQQRWFCRDCGSTLFWLSDDFPGMTGIAGGCFNDPAFPQPHLTVSNDTRQAWVTLPATWHTRLPD